MGDMSPERRKVLALELGRLASQAARDEPPELARLAILGLGLAADFLRAGKDAEAHLQSLRDYVQTGER